LSFNNDVLGPEIFVVLMEGMQLLYKDISAYATELASLSLLLAMGVSSSLELTDFDLLALPTLPAFLPLQVALSVSLLLSLY